MRLLLLTACLLLALAAFAFDTAFTWTYKGQWGEATMNIKPDGTVPTTYHDGHGTHQCEYKITRIAGTMIYVSGATAYGFTADGWMTPTHHQFIYTGREGGFADLDGTNTVPQGLLDDLAKLVPTPAVTPKDVVPGLKVEYFTSHGLGDMDKSAVMDKRTPDKVGCIDTYSIAGFSEMNSYGVKFTGYVDVPKDDLYTFYTNSDDGSVLFIDGTKIVENDGNHSPREEPGAIKLAKGLHAITVYYTQLGGAQEFTVSYAGGDAATKTPVPAGMLFRDPGDLKPIAVDAAVLTLEPAGPHGWIASASTNPYQAKSVLFTDGLRWTTNRAMAPGDWLQVDLLKGYKLKSVTLDSSKAPADAAHGVQLLLSQDGTKFEKVADLSAEDCAKTNGLVNFDLPAGAAARYVKFIQTGTAGINWWSVYSVDIEVIE